MKRNRLKYILLQVVLFITILLLFSMCAPKCASLEQNEVGFTFSEINFGGDWSHYESIENVDRFGLNAQTEPSKDEPVNLYHTISYKDKNGNRVPVVEGFDTDAVYIIDIEAEQLDTFYRATPMKITTEFIDSTSTHGPRVVSTVSDREWIQDQTNNNITLDYSMNSQPSLDIDIEITEWYCVSNAFDYSVNWEFVHKATHDNGNKDSNINLLVMAEGYRADQMDDFKAYVADAFANTANFHYEQTHPYTHITAHYTNEFFAKYWDRINVIRLDTVSPQAGIDTTWMDDVQSFFNMRRYINAFGNEVKNAPDSSRIREVLSQTKPNDIKYIYEADALIVLVNNPDIWAYSYAYNKAYQWRNGEPVTPVIIQAPAGYNPTLSNFHNHVITDAIAHELGHAMGRLQDEYVSDKYCGQPVSWYFNHYRNIDDDDDLKWQGFIDEGYDKATRYPVGKFEGGLYCPTDKFRPTEIGTMRSGNENIDPGIGFIVYQPQFGPINTYHMTATLKTRLGDIAAHAQFQVGDGSTFYEWPNYSIEDFKKDWPVSAF